MKAKDKRPGAFSALDLETQVRRAMPLAREIVLMGISELASMETHNECLQIRVEELVGHTGPGEAPAGEDEAIDIDRADDYYTASYALGIAVGQFLQPGLFTKGGPR